MSKLKIKLRHLQQKKKKKGYVIKQAVFEK